MTITRFKVGDVELSLIYARRMPQGWEKKLNKIRELNKEAYIQAVNGFSIIDAEHACHVVFNVLQAHIFGYNKLKSVEAESIMNLAFKNSFTEALQMVGVKPDHPVALFSFSRNPNVALETLTKITNYFNFEQIEFQSIQEESFNWLVNTHSLQKIKDPKMLKKLLVERSSIFYSRYRTSPPKSKPNLKA